MGGRETEKLKQLNSAEEQIGERKDGKRRDEIKEIGLMSYGNDGKRVSVERKKRRRRRRLTRKQDVKRRRKKTTGRQ